MELILLSPIPNTLFENVPQKRKRGKKRFHPVDAINVMIPF